MFKKLDVIREKHHFAVGNTHFLNSLERLHSINRPIRQASQFNPGCSPVR